MRACILGWGWHIPQVINSCWHFLSFSFKCPLGSQASRPRFLVLKPQGPLSTEAGQFGVSSYSGIGMVQGYHPWNVRPAPCLM